MEAEDSSNGEQRMPVSSSSSSRAVEAEGSISTSRAETEHHQLLQSSVRSYRVNISISNTASSSEVRDDVWSCFTVLVTFWFFASMALIMGFYGSANLQLGPNSSQLIQTNPFFVQYVKVEELDDSKPGPMLYGFHQHPQLDVKKTWSESRVAFVPANFHQEWIYFLNKGSMVEIEYSIKSPSPLSLVIAEGRESLVEWIEDPSYPNTTLSWNIIHGRGRLQQEFSKPATYYIAVGNLNSEEAAVELNFTVKAWMYNTTTAYYSCSLGNPSCSLTIHLLKGDMAVLTSPSLKEGATAADENWYIKLSYGPRWITYFIGSGVMTVITLLAFRTCNMFRTRRGGDDSDEEDEGNGEIRVEEIEGDQRIPLLHGKDEDLDSWGSSYESISHEDEDLEERFFQASSKPLAEGESCSNRQSGGGLCVICFVSPRDCFFLPCGHCAACFDCGSRISEEDGSCPICRRKMKKVRRIFTV
ncbi:hypothetical protein SAY86_022930 [Trapa natans]|uniref:RING-type domain-containing protein n=1 Tax=Trapa natans TaxID=22666 RepID=A0AAN7LU94_TRANT|nr:hypothetical protein SAY86_022930 [Trapa natans]